MITAKKRKLKAVVLVTVALILSHLPGRTHGQCFESQRFPRIVQTENN